MLIAILLCAILQTATAQAQSWGLSLSPTYLTAVQTSENGSLGTMVQIEGGTGYMEWYTQAIDLSSQNKSVNLTTTKEASKLI